MKTFKISMPITGILYKEVQAETEEEALQLVYETSVVDDIESWEPVEKIVDGNVFYGLQNEVDIEIED